MSPRILDGVFIGTVYLPPLTPPPPPLLGLALVGDDAVKHASCYVC